MHDVVVTGAGPVGLMAALCLHENKLRPLVLDSKPRSVTHSYALALHPASLELLETLGVAEAVLREASKVRTVAIYSGGRRLVAIPAAVPGARFPFIAVVGQDVLETCLTRALAERGVEVRWNHRLARFRQDPDMVAIEVDELEEGLIGYATAHFDWMVRRTHSMDARFLIGTDGHHSLVRRQLGIEFPEVKPAEHFAVFEFQGDEPLAEEVAIVLHDEGIGVLWPLPDGRGRWSFAVDPTRHPEALREKNHEPVQIIGPGAYPALEEAFFRRLLAQRAPWFQGGISHVYWRMLVRFERRLADAFGQGRIWLAGDAAHLTGPAGIQSMNVGLREADDLARGVAAAIRDGHAPNDLDGYAGARLNEWKALQGVAGSITRNGSPAAEILANKERLVSCLPASGAALGSMLGALGLGWAGQ